jgi:hypothetical protein
MAGSRGVAHLSRDLVNKLVGIVTDPRMTPHRKLDQASATIDRLIADAESPASAARHTVVAALDDAISTASELAATVSRSELEKRIRAKLVEALRDAPGLTVEGVR